MSEKKSEAPLTVDIPGPSDDKPSWVKVGIVAALGFALGIAWPRVAGVKLGPKAPAEASASATVVASNAGRAPELPSGASGGPVVVAPQSDAGASAPTTVAAAGGGAPTVSVGHGGVLNCRTDDGETKKGGACGAAPSFDAIAQPRLRRLAQCRAAEGASGKVSVVLTLDFAASSVAAMVGKSTTIDNRDSITECVRNALSGVSLADVAHEHPRYTLAYQVTFTQRSPASPPAGSSASEPSAPAVLTSPAPSPSGDVAAAGSVALVAWDVALVRESPRTGRVLVRLSRGSKVRVEGSPENGWYRVKYGASLESEGFVYRGAIGK